MDFADVIGKTIESVVLDSAADRVTFKFQDGFERSYGVEGDCCSHSWIEHLEMPNEVSGATIISVEDSDGIAYDNHECKGYDYSKTDEENTAAGACGHDSLAVYNTKFQTTKGTIVLEYRNDSNGYYGGYLIDG